jgi:hypothetical protein
MGSLHFSPALGTMARCTTPENCPFSHWDTDAMKSMAPVVLSGKPKILKKAYAGIELRPENLAPALNQLKSAMAPELFDLIVRKKAERDGVDKYHMTVVTPPEYRRLTARGEELVLPEESVRFDVLGVGTASNSKTQTWYAVVQSPVIDRWRLKLSLPKHDLHVTLGFTAADVHGVPKDLSTLV